MSQTGSQSGSRAASRTGSRQPSRQGSIHSDHEDQGEYYQQQPERSADHEQMLTAMQDDPLGQVIYQLIDSTNELAVAKGSKGKTTDGAKPLTINIYDVAGKLAEVNKERARQEREHRSTVQQLQNELQALSLTTADQQAKTMELETKTKTLRSKSVDGELRTLLPDTLDQYHNHMFYSAVPPPKEFPEEKKLLKPQDLVEAYKLFPKGNGKFTGEKNSPLTVNEFLKTMNEIQEFMELTEEEFKKRLLGSTSGRAHELLTHWIDQKSTVAKIYYQLHLNFNKQDTPYAAKQKLSNFKAYKNKGSAETEATIAQLALKAVQTIPYGPGRDNYYDHLCASTYIDSLPKETAKFVRRRYNDLAVRLNRQPTFSELSQSLDIHRMELDDEISKNGVQPKGKDKDKETGSKPKYDKKNKFVNVVQTAKETEEKKEKKDEGGKDKPAFKKKFYPKNNNKKDNKQEGKKPKHDKKEQKEQREQQNGHHVKIQMAAPQRKPFKSDKYCALCGNNTHNASDGCFKMRDAQGNILEVTPCYGDCTLCNRGLKHPEELCPFVCIVQAEQKPE